MPSTPPWSTLSVQSELVMDGFSAEIERLDAFEFEQGAWADWDAGQWNHQLLLYCFVRDCSRQCADPLRATPEDLPLLVRDPRADPEIMVQTLISKLKWQARQNDRDPLAELTYSCRAFRFSRNPRPSFFAFLWVTCLIAHGYPDAVEHGLFHERFKRVFPKANQDQIRNISTAWELLSEWLDDGQYFEGFPYQRLELPYVERWRRNISHSWYLAFPSLLDRRRLARRLENLAGKIEPFQPTNADLIQSLLGGDGFSTPLRQQLRQLSDDLVNGRPPAGWFVGFLSRSIQGLQLSSQPAGTRGTKGLSGFGPLVLRSMGYGLGVLVLGREADQAPVGLHLTDGNSLVPGRHLWVPDEPVDPGFAAFDAGSLAIDPKEQLIPELQPLISRGLLPFATDPELNLPRLAFDATCGPITHVLVSSECLELFREHVSAERIYCDEDGWQCFVEIDSSAVDLWRFPERLPSPVKEDAIRLSICGGVRLGPQEGYLGSGLGLPLVRVHGSERALKVILLTNTGGLVDYQLAHPDAAAVGPQLWQPAPKERRRTDLSSGKGRLAVFFADAPTVERALSLAALPVKVSFKREEPLAWREDWGLKLAPLMLPSLADADSRPLDPAAVAWARSRLNEGDANVNTQFEEQMLDSLTALFQRHASITRADFYQLQRELKGAKEDDWPLFEEAVLRGWCEGGWLEEGLERCRGRWRLQPVDPRLVRLEGGRAQLVGLMPSQRLVQLLVHGHQLALDIHSVSPSCPQMPRGWRFTGRVDELAQNCGLPIVEQQDWVPDPAGHHWYIDRPIESDGPTWPPGLGFRMDTHRICGRRGRGNHRQASRSILEAGSRAPDSLRIDSECSRYGRRRWHSHDHECGRVFTSCHRNRVALHALVVATNGNWPFGITDATTGQIDRLYDADAYLPLPVGRHAALTGSQMPGPIRHRRSDHTYRYHLDATFLRAQTDQGLLPLST